MMMSSSPFRKVNWDWFIRSFKGVFVFKLIDKSINWLVVFINQIYNYFNHRFHQSVPSELRGRTTKSHDTNRQFYCSSVWHHWQNIGNAYSFTDGSQSGETNNRTTKSKWTVWQTRWCNLWLNRLNYKNKTLLAKRKQKYSNPLK